LHFRRSAPASRYAWTGRRRTERQLRRCVDPACPGRRRRSLRMSDTLQATDKVDDLVQAIADLITDAYDEGMDLNEVLSMVAIVATDIGRAQFGEDYVDILCGTIKLRRDRPLPNTETAPLN